MIWGYSYAEIDAHLSSLGFRLVRTTDLTLIFRCEERFFTIRRPNVHGFWPEPTVLDAFDAAGVPPPGPATEYVD